MLHQYNPQRFTFREIGGAIRKVGTVPVGAILRLQASFAGLRYSVHL